MGEDNWLQFGDVGYVDRDGFLVVGGRPDDIIARNGGEQIFPYKIENTVRLELPCLSEVRQVVHQ